MLGSTIIGLENHTPENIDEVIDYAAHYATVFHQFMLYTPLPGTPLFRDLTSQGRMKDESECELADIHGQYIMNYRHPHIPSGMESELLLRAFQRDLEVNGPSVVRNVRTLLAGWKRYKDHPDSRIRRHYAYESRELSGTYSALVAATRMYYRGNVEMQARLDLLLKDLHHEFGWKSRFYSALGGPYALWRIRREAARLAHGWTYEPPTFYEQNEAAKRIAPANGPSAVLCRPLALLPHPKRSAVARSASESLAVR